MEVTEITGNLKTKIEEAKKISGLNSKHFGFKNWHTTTLNLLRNLPSNYLPEINDFKKLAFVDTKFHRGNRYFSQTDNTKYREDLESAIVILKKILDLSKAEKPEKSADKTSKTDGEKKLPVKKPGLKKPGDILTDSIKKAKKPKTSKDMRSPAKTGKAPGRKKKPKK
jgi:hypothetical protein